MVPSELFWKFFSIFLFQPTLLNLYQKTKQPPSCIKHHVRRISSSLVNILHSFRAPSDLVLHYWMGGHESSSEYRHLQRRHFRRRAGWASWLVPPGHLRQRPQVRPTPGRDLSRNYVHPLNPPRPWTSLPLLEGLCWNTAVNRAHSFHCRCQPQVWWQAANGHVFILTAQRPDHLLSLSLWGLAPLALIHSFMSIYLYAVCTTV